jgi:hypothetical protein
MSDDAWEGTVTKKSRGLLDGSNMYRRLRVRRTDGQTARVRVSRDLWRSIDVGDVLVKQAGHEPAKKHAS